MHPGLGHVHTADTAAAHRTFQCLSGNNIIETIRQIIAGLFQKVVETVRPNNQPRIKTCWTGELNNTALRSSDSIANGNDLWKRV